MVIGTSVDRSAGLPNGRSQVPRLPYIPRNKVGSSLPSRAGLDAVYACETLYKGKLLGRRPCIRPVQTEYVRALDLSDEGRTVKVSTRLVMYYLHGFFSNEQICP